MDPSTCPSQTAPIRRKRLLLAGDYTAVRQGLRQLIELVEGECDITEASFGDDAVGLAQRIQADLVLLDLEAGRRGEAKHVITRLKCCQPAPQVFVLTVHDDAQIKDEARVAGADGIFVKGRETQDLLAAVHQFLIRSRFSS